MLAILAAACSPPAPTGLSDQIQRRVVIADLMTAQVQATESPSGPVEGRPTHLGSRIEIPVGAHLELIGVVPKSDAAKKRPRSATFTVTVDLEPVFSKTVDYKKTVGRIEEVLDLGHLAGRTVDLELRIEESRGRAAAHWRRATLETTEILSRQPAGSGPNMLFVVVDTLRADHCSLYGYHRPTTPFLERFAEQSTVFDHAVAQAPWTLPSVATMLTGAYPNQHEVVAGTRSLGFAWRTLAEVAQESGLTTFAVSANPLIAPKKNFDQGFETMDVFANVPGDEINAAVVNRLDAAAGTRFFGYVHYMDPHTPYNSAAPAGTAFVDSGYDGVFTDPRAIDRLAYTVDFGLEPLFPVEDEDLDYLVGRYDGDILYWDHAFEELVAELDLRGLLDDTIIILTSDHGEEFLEHGMVKHGQQLYHESIHVPLLIRPPGAANAQTHIEEPFELVHLYQATLRLMRFEAVPSFDFEDVKGLSNGRVFAHAMPASQPGAPWPRHRLASFMADGWKVIDWLDEDRRELYDMDNDPGETDDLLGTRTDIADHLLQLLEEQLALGAEESGRDEAVDTEDLEQLRALGYIQ